MMATSGELDRIRERYSRRATRYDPWSPAVYLPRQEFERRALALLVRARQLPPDGRRVLEIGCGHGNNLRWFVGLGFEPGNIFGNELQEQRAAAATASVPPGVTVLTGDASALDLPEESFDVVFQSVVFSSILDDDLQQAVAGRMWSLAKPRGGILWYDFAFDNPRNPDVRGVPLRRVRELFPVTRIAVQRLTLAPPLGRALCAIHPSLYSLANLIVPLRTHRLCWIPKAAEKKRGARHV